jgi:hypothetical protein
MPARWVDSNWAGMLVPRNWQNEKGPATAWLRWSILPVPTQKVLVRATRKALHAARRALPGRGHVRLEADEEGDPSGLMVKAHIFVYGVTPDPKTWLPSVEAAFVQAFEAAVEGEHRLKPLPSE